MKTLRSCIAATIALVAIMAVTSCVDSTRVPSTAPEVPVGVAAPRASLLDVSFLSCTPLTADTVTQSIGPSGGTINVGPHQIVFPEDALDSTVSITAIAPSDTINRVQLFPEGLEFGKQVLLKLSYANCSAISALVPKRVAYVDSSFSVLDLLASMDAWWSQVVTGKTQHFSDYVVAW